MTVRKFVFGLAIAIVVLSCGAMSLAAARTLGLI